MTAHPLDRPVWNAFTTRQSAFAVGGPHALRIDPEMGLFAAMADTSEEGRAALAALMPEEGVLGLVEPAPPVLPAGVAIVKQARCVQMVAECLNVPVPDMDYQTLGDSDTAEMLALATRTEPGPFAIKTHRLGNFIGIRHDGALIAMAGERMRPPGFTEVSGVCTHPDFRGRGYAKGLMALVAQGILDRGEVPFLHAYADHAATIALYERLGFRVRATLVYTLIARQV
ncbi:GNAT family N-acetyltransferase [Stakelama sediminis]|uniref:Putative GNAT family acetyltransferase n=1 Tax=Stakelama sediminis TaxID=463200 RepID=A0A840Z058_9SPHN|nr:GNAT family N-acetyltransferase [Stakelama sediminis]MBB5719265.1 putative GNAT family acetyltransferase [Stakelama sediminis]